jgi:HEAT repeat protein
MIVKALGRLATPEAVSQIKDAAGDFNPQVRSAACNAISQLPKESVDEEILRLVKLRLTDQPQYVADSAREAAMHIGISASSGILKGKPK